MKVSVLSDFHFGYAYNSELENDSFENAEEAFEKSLDSDLILIAGDVFDTRTPKTQTWGNAIKVLTKPLLKESSGVKLIDSTKKLKEISKRTLNHIPVIAIHGNHERRSREEINPVETLENAGILIHLHCDTLVFEKNGIKVAVHGMSNVNESSAYETLSQWNPKPLPDCINILMIHQNIDPYIYSPLENTSLNCFNLPKGFDIIINGHIHKKIEENINNSKLIMPGSLTTTQFQKDRDGEDQYFVKINITEYESKNNEKDVVLNKNRVSFDFVPLERSRKFFYLEIEANGNLNERVENRINEIILNKNFFKSPVIRIKITGKETEIFDHDLRELEKKYSGKAILIFSKELETPEITEKIEFLKNLRDQKMSTEEIGLNILKKNLDEVGFGHIFDYEDFFKILSEGDVENAFSILVGEQKRLSQMLKIGDSK